MSERIAVVNPGRVDEIRRSTEIDHAPATPFVARFWGKKRG